MAAKRKTKTNKKEANSSKSFLILILLVFLGICTFFYFTNPEFKQKVDNGYVTLMEYLYPTEEIQTESADAQAENQSAPAAATTPAPDGVILLSDQLFKPLCPAKNHAQDHELRDYKYYSICYREAYEQAEWSAYCLDDSQLIKNAGRSDDFRPDPAISTGSATLADYKASGYDRGHLSPAADFAFSQEAMSETFYMSNMSPQAGSFNRGIWKDLESNVREWAKKFGRVYVISGPVLDEKPEAYATIGKNKVSVPKYYYKVLLAPLYQDEADKATKDDAVSITAIGFLFPNKKCDDSFFNYCVSIDEIESRTGIDFFNLLEDSVENEIEKNTDSSLWR